MRLGEIINLKWKNVNLATKIITVCDEEFITKGREKIIPVGNSYVFCKNNGEKFTGDYISQMFKRACKAAGMDSRIHFHTLRHSFASNLAQKGVSLYTIKELLGHSSISTTEIYSHLNIEALQKAIKTFDEHLPNSQIQNNGSALKDTNASNSSYVKIFKINSGEN